jgi:gliding motility-associated-like protein
MAYAKFFLRTILFIGLIAFPKLSQGQFTATICQTVTDALIATDRNDWAHANLPIPNEGYLHNFDPPVLPCGINNPSVTSLVITIDVTNITSSTECSGIPIYGNVLLNCALTTTSVCTIIQDVLTPGCGAFGGGATVTGLYSLDIATCSTISANDIIGVDIIPATDYSASCPSNGAAIADGLAAVVYEICIEYTYDQDIPASCANTISLPCDDANPCTSNDVILVDECDNDIICLPCAGSAPFPCTNTISLPCDDGNPCTSNDVIIVEECDDTNICVPCTGVLADCDDVACQTTVPCDDGNPCTENDTQTLAADGSTCIPCAGIAAPCGTDETCEITIPCDDNNPCTVNDVEVQLLSDGSICMPCQGEELDCTTGTTTIQNCDDGNPNTTNDTETILDCDGSICIPCQGQVPEKVYMPNAFSPNGDGINDVFTVYSSSNIKLVKALKVFDRWGAAIFSGSDFAPNDLQNGWDGKSKGEEVAAGVYVYFVQIEYQDGRIEIINGDVMVIK